MMCLPKSDDYTRRSETDRFLSANESEEESGSALLGLVLRRTLRSDRRTWLFQNCMVSTQQVQLFMASGAEGDQV